MLSRRFGLDREANFEGAWHLHVFKAGREVARGHRARREDDATHALDDGARASCSRRATAASGRAATRRSSPAGTASRSRASPPPARALERDDYVDSAARAVAFLREHCWYDGRLLAVHKDGRSRFPAYLDDYAFLAWGLLELLQARWHGPWLAWAIELAEAMLAHFEDRDAGGFFFTADDHEPLILRPKTFGDDATPAGNGVAARVLLRLGYLLAEPRYLDAAEAHAARGLAAARALSARAHGSLLHGARRTDRRRRPIVVLRGPRDDLDTWRDETRQAVRSAPHGRRDSGDAHGPAAGARRQAPARRHRRLRLSRHDLLGAACDAGRTRARAADRRPQ